jgi:membrane-associated phospholipid phosphatase
MRVLVVGLGLAALVGAATTFIVLRWPASKLAAPTLQPSTIVHEIEIHRSLRRMLRTAARRHLDPKGVMGGLLGLAVLVTALTASLFGIIAVMVRLNVGLARWDRSASTWGARHATTASTNVLDVITSLGGLAVGSMFLVAAAVVAVWRHRKWEAIVVNLTKVIVDRARPDIDRLTAYSGSSFPSGHAAHAAAFYAAAALVLGIGSGRVVRAVLAGGAVAIAIVVAATRVLLGVHWLTDVVGGLAMGWGWFAVVSVAFGGRWLHFAAPVELAEAVAERTAAEPATDTPPAIRKP